MNTLIFSMAAGWACLLPSVGAPDAESSASAKPFAKGVRIDWELRRVEVDGHVVLREGPLELFACSRHTREHESIVAIQARPYHVYQAMGLIGLEPGSPVRYDAKQNRWYPPAGTRVEIKVRYDADSLTYTVPAQSWMQPTDPVVIDWKIDWVFAGSMGGAERFGADSEGTVAAVVDFETALIAPASLHSSDNRLLWLMAHTAAIPGRGTACTLLINANEPARKLLELSVGPSGALARGAERISFEDAAESVIKQEGSVSPPPYSGVILQPQRGVPAAGLGRTVRRLQEAGVPANRIELRPPPPPDNDAGRKRPLPPPG